MDNWSWIVQHRQTGLLRTSSRAIDSGGGLFLARLDRSSHTPIAQISTSAVPFPPLIMIMGCP